MNRNRMLRVTISLLVFMVFIFSAHTVQAAFDSGSTGADGVFNPTENILLDMPDDGVFNFTTVNIPVGVTVSFNRNANNTSVTILATGDVLIDGTITVSAKNGSGTVGGMGGPGGGDGGDGAFRGEDGKRGEGIGGGGGGAGRLDNLYYAGGGGGAGFGYVGNDGQGQASYLGGKGGIVYGSERLIPFIGGSGGGGAGAGSDNTYPGGGGGGGGGAILIASSGDITIDGSILARGGAGTYVGYWGGSGSGGGSGGAVRLIANIIKGSGLIEARGQGGGSAYRRVGGSGHWGRIRLEAFAVELTNAPLGVISTMYSPYPVLPPTFPGLKIVKVGATDIIERPTALINGMPDVELPFEQENPISVRVVSVNIPDGTAVAITVMPSKGETTTFTGTLSSSSVSIDVTLPGGFTSILHATVTYDAPTASLGGPIYADGEKVEKIRVSSVMGGASEVVYITESGKEIVAKM